VRRWAISSGDSFSSIYSFSQLREIFIIQVFHVKSKNLQIINKALSDGIKTMEVNERGLMPLKLIAKIEIYFY
jgi:hypothetical protein